MRESQEQEKRRRMGQFFNALNEDEALPVTFFPLLSPFGRGKMAKLVSKVI